MTQTVIGYARLSTASEESTSIERQREVITATAAARGWTLLDIIEDPAASASKLRLNRPGLDRVRHAVATGQAQAVLVWRLDRIARSVVDFGTLLDEGVNIVSCTEPLDTTSPMGRAMAEILQVFAAMEARTISARVSSSVDYLRRNQRFPGGRVPYGYRPAPHPSGVGRALEIHPDEAAIVQEATERALAGESLYSIARDLTRRGVPTKAGAPGWSTAVLRAILLGDAVLGRVKSKGQLVLEADGLPAPAWPPVITLDDHLALRGLLTRQRAAQPRTRAARLLSGVIVCQSCARPLIVQIRSDGKRTYRCTSNTNGFICERPVTIAAEPTEAHVVAQFLALVGSWPVVEERLTAPPTVGLAEVEDAITATASAMTERDADLPALMARMASLQERRASLDAQGQVPQVELVETGLTFAETWAAREGQLDAQRALLSSAVREVTVAPVERAASRRWTPDRITLVWTR